MESTKLLRWVDKSSLIAIDASGKGRSRGRILKGISPFVWSCKSYILLVTLFLNPLVLFLLPLMFNLSAKLWVCLHLFTAWLQFIIFSQQKLNRSGAFIRMCEQSLTQIRNKNLTLTRLKLYKFVWTISPILLAIVLLSMCSQSQQWKRYFFPTTSSSLTQSDPSPSIVWINKEIFLEQVPNWNPSIMYAQIQPKWKNQNESDRLESTYTWKWR